MHLIAFWQQLINSVLQEHECLILFYISYNLRITLKLHFLAKDYVIIYATFL